MTDPPEIHARPVERTAFTSAQVEDELTHLLYRSAGFSLIANAILAVLLVCGVWAHANPRTALVWGAAILTVYERDDTDLATLIFTSGTAGGTTGSEST